jgi:hypothetical protein
MGDDVKMGFKGRSAEIVKVVDNVRVNAWMKQNLNYSFGDDWKVSRFNPDRDVDAIHFLGVSIVRDTVSFDIVRWVKKISLRTSRSWAEEEERGDWKICQNYVWCRYVRS